MVDPKGILETPKRTVYPSVCLATWDCAGLLLSHVSCADHGLNWIVKHVQSCESISCIRSYCATILPSRSDDNCFSETELFAVACFRYLRRIAPQKDAAQRTRDKNRETQSHWRKHNLWCYTGSFWLLQHDDTALFLACKIVICSQLCIQLAMNF